MARRRKRYDVGHRGNTTFGLNITSMTDMFTILLVFLLQTYSTAEIQVSPDEGQSLPLSGAQTNPTLTLQVSLTKKDLKIEQRSIASLENQNFVKQDIDPNDSNFILPLFKELEKIAKEEEAKAKAAETDPTVKFNKGVVEGKIILKADSSFDYGTLRKVMYTASMAGFPKLKLATVIGE
ncbi:MAG: biopolymer transporter ExbD [Proteobacteria bacterium]|jgi:biopolymer transport protein ExbD|nr:biopolymer transporter ExbD [Pseudomonadota bacterium]